MSSHYKYPLIFTAFLLIAFCLIFFSYHLIHHVHLEYPNWQGESKDQNWEAVFKKMKMHRMNTAANFIGSVIQLKQTTLIWNH
ncbi:DUF4944 domain-containing protein [Bacillus subtilis]|uniref:DUF4944 domain-containing protein n=1 Tax=Bacillus subtilis TaxID=1423 RepID=UPI000AC8E3E0